MGVVNDTVAEKFMSGRGSSLIVPYVTLPDMLDAFYNHRDCM